MKGPQSVFEEVVRLIRIERLLLKSGLLEYLEKSDLKELTDAVIWADLDSHRNDQEWLDDVIKSVHWLSSKSESESSRDWVELLNEAVRMQGKRLSCVYDDEDEGESWKRV